MMVVVLCGFLLFVGFGGYGWYWVDRGYLWWWDCGGGVGWKVCGERFVVGVDCGWYVDCGWCLLKNRFGCVWIKECEFVKWFCEKILWRFGVLSKGVFMSLIV